MDQLNIMTCDVTQDSIKVQKTPGQVGLHCICLKHLNWFHSQPVNADESHWAIESHVCLQHNQLTFSDAYKTP